LNESPVASQDFQRISCVCPDQWLYLLGGKGVVYSQTQNRFAGLDSAGVFVYRAFDAGASMEDLKELISEAGIDDVGSGNGLRVIHRLSRGIFPDEEASEAWPAFNPSMCHLSSAANITIAGIPLVVECPPGVLEDLCRDYFRDCQSTDKAARCCLSAQYTEKGWMIFVNGHEYFPIQHERQLGLGLMHAARALFYAEGDYDVAFHAAMVAHDDCGIMLCAPRECGKSTLAAYLTARGFELLTDEPALLRLDTWSVEPLRLPISVKQGSWRVLEDQLPQLIDTPVHIRSDGTKIRLAHPSDGCYSAGSRPVTQIVFPQYRSKGEAQIRSVSALHTLWLLSESGMTLAPHFSRTDFERFLALICYTPAYQIQYSSLEEASQMLQELCD
jgi:hypothetical protein